MPTIKQLPSGSYNTLVYDYTDPNGKRHYKSITAPSKKEVKLLVAEFLASREERSCTLDNITIEDAIQKYINAKNNVLSPSTVRVYDIMLESRFDKIKHRKVRDFTASDMQTFINDLSEEYTPKTVRNTNSLLRSAIEFVNPNFKAKITLPQKVKPDINIPTEVEMQTILNAVKGKRLEVPVYLAAFCGLRRSEIAALMWKDVDLDKGTITVRAASVQNKDGKVIRKQKTKTTDSKRTIRLFTPVLNLLKEKEHTSEYVEYYPHPNRITDAYTELLKQSNLPHYRFHDLRHYTVSTMILLNIPKKYIADYLGHETERMIDEVYGHVMRDKKDALLDNVNAYFCKIHAQMQDKMQDENL